MGKKLKILILVSFLIILVSCSDNLNVKCCEQCLNGATRDVRGMDISSKLCLSYQNSNLVNASGDPIELLNLECVEYFNKNKLTVNDCNEE
jgi:hypothetical protein